MKPDDLVFVQEDGAPLNRMIETRAWKKALQRVGLPGDFVAAFGPAYGGDGDGPVGNE